MLHDGVSKAVFYIAEKSGAKYNVSEPLKVLFNPSEILVSVDRSRLGASAEEPKSKAISSAKEGNGSEGSGTNIPQEVNTDKIVSMDLIFDLVEKYEYKRSGGSKSFFDDSWNDDIVDNSLNEISVLNESCCCLPKLADALENSYPVRFVWGSNIEFEGRISNLTMSLTYFSEKGAPLRANVNLKIQEGDFDNIFGKS